MDRGTNKTSNLSKGGIFTALGVIFVYLSSIIPVNKLFLLGIASSIIPLSVVTTNMKNTIIVYFATSVISLFVSGSKFAVISYIIFFGLYGIIKYYIERIRKIYIEFILKLAFFNSVVLILFCSYKAFFPDIINVNMPLYILVAGSEIVFLIYDYALSLFISYTNRYLHKKI